MGGLTNLLLLLCVGITVSTVLDLQRRVEGGKNCGKTEHPYHVKILDGNDNFICGGSMLKNNWILTAAHCEKSHMKAVVGGQTKEITAPSHKYEDTLKRQHDIMLLKLPEGPKIEHIIGLPECKPVQIPPKDATVKVAGHGAKTKTPYKALQCADLEVTKCPGGIDHPKPDRNMFCGKSPKGKIPTVEICFGDSGGGVEYEGRIHGVIHDSAAGKCGDFPGFVAVCRYKAWIEKIIAKK